MPYALIGYPLGHSYSATLHAAFGLDYTLQEVPPEGLASFISCCQLDGFNVTIPHKQAIIPYLDSLSPLASRLGAVNTVKREGDVLVGYNTDYIGFTHTLTHYGVDVGGKTALVLGTGGAGHMARVALEDMGAKVVMVSRTGDINYDNCYSLHPDIIVNATPVGMYPHLDATPIQLGRFEGVRFVFDLVYNPYRTRLLLDAMDLGIPCCNGLRMLVEQALAARRIWTEQDYNVDMVEQGVSLLLAQTRNLALVGMPSVGKTTVGSGVARCLDMSFVDTDVVIARHTGRTPAQIILEDGESAFRAIEAEVVAHCCRRQGCVLALGGGSILSADSRRYLRQTATVVWLQRDLSCLTDANRPTLQAQGAQAMYAMRKPLYQEVSDYVVESDSLKDAIDQVLNIWQNKR